MYLRGFLANLVLYLRRRFEPVDNADRMEVVLAEWHSHDQAIRVELVHAYDAVLLLELVIVEVALHEHAVVQFLKRFIFQLFPLV